MPFASVSIKIAIGLPCEDVACEAKPVDVFLSVVIVLIPLLWVDIFEKREVMEDRIESEVGIIYTDVCLLVGAVNTNSEGLADDAVE